MKIMMVGDSHQDHRFMTGVINRAGEWKIQHILVLGDFGLWTHDPDGVAFLDRINEVADANKATVYAIGGNHENWDHWNWFVENMPKGGKGWAMVRSRVALAPRVHTWKWDNTRFLGVGGAVSIDRDARLHLEQHGYTGRGGSGPKTLWWPNEELTDEDVESILRINTAAYNVDVLVSHDCSNYTPFQGRLKPDLNSQIHRQRIDKVLRHTQPDFHFHGHMHTKYDWLNTQVHGFQAGTQTYGLECNGMWDAFGVFDTTTKEFLWRGERNELDDFPSHGGSE